MSSVGVRIDTNYEKIVIASTPISWIVYCCVVAPTCSTRINIVPVALIVHAALVVECGGPTAGSHTAYYNRTRGHGCKPHSPRLPTRLRCKLFYEHNNIIFLGISLLWIFYAAVGFVLIRVVAVVAYFILFFLSQCVLYI